MKVAALNFNKTKALQIYLNRFGVPTTVDGDPGSQTLDNYHRVLALLGIVETDDLTEAIELHFADRVREMDIVLGLIPAPVPPKPGVKINPVYWSKGKFHPRFEHLLPAPYTHLHPYDIARSVAGETEIPGPKHNPFISHLHEHSLNLTKHRDGSYFADEVPHCSSGINWSCDGGGGKKSNNALAISWIDANPKVEGDWVEVGDVITKRTGKQNHVTFCNKRFNRRTATTYEGYGFNQGNSIKTTVYAVSEITSVTRIQPLPGTVWAPIGFLGHKPIPATGNDNESTR